MPLPSSLLSSTYGNLSKEYYYVDCVEKYEDSNDKEEVAPGVLIKTFVITFIDFEISFIFIIFVFWAYLRRYIDLIIWSFVSHFLEELNYMRREY